MARKKPSEPKYSTVQELLDKINQTYQYGNDRKVTIARASTLQRWERIPFNILSMDYLTGGGVPQLKISMFTGWEGTCKSPLGYKLLAEAQRHCPLCDFIKCSCDNRQPVKVLVDDLEGMFDPKTAESIGVDLGNCLLIQPDKGEQGVDVADEFLRSGMVKMVLVDSLANLTSQKELEKSAEDDTVGVMGKLGNQAMRRWLSALNRIGLQQKTGPALVFINQWRSKVGVMWGDPRVNPAGHGQQYANSIKIELTIKEKGSLSGKKDNDEGFDFLKIGAYCSRNKTYPFGKRGGFEFWFTEKDGHRLGEFEETKYVMAMALKYEVVTHQVRWRSSITSKSFTSEKMLIEYLKTTELGRDLQGPPVYLWEALKNATLKRMMKVVWNPYKLIRKDSHAPPGKPQGW